MTELKQAANVEVARQAIDAFNRRDVDAMRALGDEDFVYDWSRSKGPIQGVYRGPDGFMEMKGAPTTATLPRRARDEQAAARLWDISVELTKVDF